MQQLLKARKSLVCYFPTAGKDEAKQNMLIIPLCRSIWLRCDRISFRSFVIPPWTVVSFWKLESRINNPTPNVVCEYFYSCWKQLVSLAWLLAIHWVSRPITGSVPDLSGTWLVDQSEAAFLTRHVWQLWSQTHSSGIIWDWTFKRCHMTAVVSCGYGNGPTSTYWLTLVTVSLMWSVGSDMNRLTLVCEGKSVLKCSDSNYS